MCERTHESHAASLTAFSVLVSDGKVCLCVCTGWNYKVNLVGPQQLVYISKPSLSSATRKASGIPFLTV